MEVESTFTASIVKTVGRSSPVSKQLEMIWDAATCNDYRAHILNELQIFDETGSCDENCMRLFEAFGYISGVNTPCPFFTRVPRML